MLFKILLWIYLSYILYRVAAMLLNDSWKDDLEDKSEVIVYLIVSSILLLLWPVFLVIQIYDMVRVILKR